MSDGHDQALATIAADYQRASEVASAVCRLIVKGRQLGELIDRPYRDHCGGICSDKIPPGIWFDRLARAITVGASDRLTVDQIVVGNLDSRVNLFCCVPCVLIHSSFEI